MSAGDNRTNESVTILAAGETRYNITASFGGTTTKRVRLELQVTGSAPALGRWENKVTNDGGDFILPVGVPRIFQDPCPQGKLSLQAPAGATTVSMIELTVDKGSRQSGVVR